MCINLCLTRVQWNTAITILVYQVSVYNLSNSTQRIHQAITMHCYLVIITMLPSDHHNIYRSKVVRQCQLNVSFINRRSEFSGFDPSLLHTSPRLLSVPPRSRLLLITVPHSFDPRCGFTRAASQCASGVELKIERLGRLSLIQIWRQWEYFVFFTFNQNRSWIHFWGISTSLTFFHRI